MIVEFNKRIFSCQCNRLWGQNEQNRPLYLSISTNKEKETSNKKPVLQNGLFVFGSQRGLE